MKRYLRKKISCASLYPSNSQKQGREGAQAIKSLVYETGQNLMEAMMGLRDHSQPWKLSALWRTKDACFYKVSRRGSIRLYRTGTGLGFCWADLKMRPAHGGGTVIAVSTATTAGAPWITWLLCVICTFGTAKVWVESGSGAVIRLLPYLLLCLLALLLTLMTGRETSKLLRFLEDTLRWKPSK